MLTGKAWIHAFARMIGSYNRQLINGIGITIEPDGKTVLACQYRVECGLMVTIPEGTRFFANKIVTSGVDTKAQIDFTICRKYQAGAGDKVFGVAVEI